MFFPLLEKYRERFFLLLILPAFVSGMYSCAERRSSLEKEKKPSLETKVSKFELQNETKFKQWLKDTLIALNLHGSDKYNRSIKVADDSLSMDIIDSYYLRVDKNYDKKNRELMYALDLLDRNRLMPKGKFSLEFEIVCYYSISMVEQLTYEFDSEILKFEVEDNRQIAKYNFLKGNLIDKIITFKK
jgi:hypothetical protein